VSPETGRKIVAGAAGVVGRGCRLRSSVSPAHLVTSPF